MSGWDLYSARLTLALEQYYQEQGLSADSPAARGSVRTNTELIPRRAGHLLEVLEHLGGVPSLERRAVLEAGSGFGALAAYLACEARADVTAVDVREQYVQIASDVTADLSFSGALAYRTADLRSLDQLALAPFDVAVANNVLVYMVTPQDLGQVLRNLHDALRPGGVLVFNTANRWVLREPFTQDPLMHHLPAGVAARVGSLTGWKGSHGRVRYVGPRGLRRALEQAGFVDTRIARIVADRVLTRGYGTARFFAGVARRAPAS